MMIKIFPVLLRLSVIYSAVNGFMPQYHTPSLRTELRLTTINNDNHDVSGVTITLSLKKPLGLLLEEVEEGLDKGVFVKEISESGSASELSDDIKNKIIGATITTIQKTDITRSNFVSVIESIMQGPETVEVEFLIASAMKQYDEGTKVTILVQQKGKPDTSIVARVGDNLRQKLLEYDVQVYEGLKQNLGNCGGAGQCTFCAFDFSDTDGWEARSEYEDKKLNKFPIARLTCLNRIQGPATIVKTTR